jgi:hypothetical protein
MKTMSDSTAATSSTFGAITTLVFWIFSLITLSQVAATITIIAGVTTIAVNVQRYFINKKNKKHE